jgi:hypothetical protein
MRNRHSRTTLNTVIVISIEAGWTRTTGRTPGRIVPESLAKSIPERRIQTVGSVPLPSQSRAEGSESYSAWKILLQVGVTEQQDKRYNQRVNGKRLDHGQTDDHGGQDSTAGFGIP